MMGIFFKYTTVSINLKYLWIHSIKYISTYKSNVIIIILKAYTLKLVDLRLLDFPLL